MFIRIDPFGQTLRGSTLKGFVRVSLACKLWPGMGVAGYGHFIIPFLKPFALE
jgi:hypothetical protein